MGAGSFLSSIASFRRRVTRLKAEDHQPCVEDANDVPVNSQSSNVHQLLQGFHTILAERLHHLQFAGGSCPPHINWLVDAFAVTLSTHAGFQGTLNSSLHNSSTVASISDHERHTDEVVGQLDVCHALKHVMAEGEAHVARLQTALHSIDEALQTAAIPPCCLTDRTLDNNVILCRFPALRKATRRLSTSLQDHECDISATTKLLMEARAALLKIAKRSGLVQPKFRYSSSRVGTSEADQSRSLGVLMNEAAVGAMLTTLLVLASAVSSLTPPAQQCWRRSQILLLNKLAAAGGKNGGGSVPVLVASLLQLQQELARSEENLTGGGALFMELRNVRATAAKLERGLLCAEPSNMLDVRQDVARLRKSLAEVQESSSTIRSQTASLFHALLAYRLHFL